MDRNKRVFIVKNNSFQSDIYKNAEKSFLKDTKEQYYTWKENRKRLEKEAQKGDKGLFLFLTYGEDKAKDVTDIFIGEEAEVLEDMSVTYKMRRHLSGENDARAIQSIIDKMDLNIDEDFTENTYVLVSDMRSLYEELRERINSLKKNTVYNANDREVQGDYRLDPLAQNDCQAVRIFDEAVLGDRTEFQRDRERIVNSTAFRRMVDKAQIFSAEKGDYFRTRMTHTLEVNQIAKAIAFALHLNIDLTEAIALGHDLGHTPFGHQGERTLDKILCGEIDAGIVTSKELLKNRCYGGFKHNYQSAKILTQSENKYIPYKGLNVSIQVVEGVLKHTRMKKEIDLRDFLGEEYRDKIHFDYSRPYCPIATLEGQVVAIADEIAQRGHDVDDALTSGVMSVDEFVDLLSIGKCDDLRNMLEGEIEGVENAVRIFPNKRKMLVARIVHRIIRYFISDVTACSRDEMEKNLLSKIDMNNTKMFIAFSPKAKKVNNYLEKIVQKKVICNYEVARADYNAEVVIKTLFRKYYENPRLLHTGTLHKIFIDTLTHKNIYVSNSAVCLNDCSIAIVDKEIEEMTRKEISEKGIKEDLGGSEAVTPDVIRYEKRRILIRAIVDIIAGMTDGYALQEYERIK